MDQPSLFVMVIGENVWGKAETISKARLKAGVRTNQKHMIYIVNESARVVATGDIEHDGKFKPMRIQ
jgi:hypothetical protein